MGEIYRAMQDCGLIRSTREVIEGWKGMSGSVRGPSPGQMRGMSGPRCAKCGWPEHSGVHLPAVTGARAGKAWGHDFVPAPTPPTPLPADGGVT